MKSMVNWVALNQNMVLASCVILRYLFNFIEFSSNDRVLRNVLDGLS